MKTLSLVLVVLVCAGWGQSVSAAVPQTMSYQGVLRDGTGNVVPDDSYDLTFKLYDGPTGGTALWTETQPVPVEDGIFNVILGHVAQLSLPFDVVYWLGISIEGEPELTPRVELTSAPYALRANYADVADDGDWSKNGNNLYRYVGNIGIGTVTPVYAVDITRDEDDLVGIRIKNNHTGSQSREGICFGNEDGDIAGIYLYDNDSAYSSAMSIWNNRPGGHIRLNTGSVERMRVANNGYVGIGTSYPAVLLDVAGVTRTESFQMPTGASDGYVLTSDATGNGTWLSAPGGGLTLPYAGSASDTGTVFTITNTSTGPAIRGFGMWPYNQTYGQLGDSFYGVFGQDMDTRNYGYLGHNNSGVYGRAYTTDAVGVRGRHDSTGHYGYLGSETHGGYFGGNVTIADGNLGIGEDTPTRALWVSGEGMVTSYQNTRTLDLINSYDGQLSQMVSMERIGVPNELNDMLQINTVSGSPDAMQFIECERGSTIEFAVDGDGFVYSRGGASFFDGVSLEEGSLYVTGDQLRSGYFSTDYLSSSAHVVEAQYLGTGGYDAVAVYGKSRPTNNFGYGGYFEGGYYGVYAKTNSEGSGVYRGVYGTAENGTGTNTGIYGYATSQGGTARGVYGAAGGTGTLYAGYFSGNVTVSGTLSKTAGSFKIDHPLDPANKYLYHSFVESPDMMNIYNGNVVLDSAGEAQVVLPDWFEALNGDYRYQLTAIGAPGPNLYVAEEIHGNSFRIAGGQPGMKVSWQVTGVRQDAYAKAHRIPVEENKPATEAGKYLHPELYGASRTLGVDYEEPPRELPVSETEIPERPQPRVNQSDGE
ncbi:MAG: hypothetical protein JXB46_02975 [Candidatus Eisenbacteria bacterium]|nr:hypothetical protein [Candidatus Eisenbacteria bacterium]